MSEGITYAFDVDANGAISAVRRVGKEVKKTDTKTKKLGKSFTALGASAVAGALIAARAWSAVTETAEQSAAKFRTFEHSVSVLNGLMKISGDKLKFIKDGIKQIGKSTGISPALLAEGAFPIASKGARDQDLLDQLKEAARLSLAGGDKGTVATGSAVASIVKQFVGTTAKEAGDLVAMVNNLGEFDIKGIAVAVGKTAATFNNANTKLDTFAGIMTKASFSIPADEVATAMKTFVNDLDSKPALQEAFGNSKDIGMLKVVENLLNLKKTNSDKFKKMSLVFGETGRLVMRGLVIDNENSANVIDIINDFKNKKGELDKQVKPVKGTDQFKLDVFQVRRNIVDIDSGEDLSKLVVSSDKIRTERKEENADINKALGEAALSANATGEKVASFLIREGADLATRIGAFISIPFVDAFEAMGIIEDGSSARNIDSANLGLLGGKRSRTREQHESSLEFSEGRLEQEISQGRGSGNDAKIFIDVIEKLNLLLTDMKNGGDGIIRANEKTASAMEKLNR